MELEYLKAITNQDSNDPRLIQTNDAIDEETFELLVPLKTSDFERCFAKPKDASDKHSHDINFKCVNNGFCCNGIVSHKSCSKLKISRITKDMRIYKRRLEEHKNGSGKPIEIEEVPDSLLCADCLDLKKSFVELNEHLAEERMEEDRKWLEEQADEWIEQEKTLTLDPTKQFNPGISVKEKFELIQPPQDSKGEHERLLEQAVKSMKYHDFLKTPYWNACACRRRQMAGYACELCGATGVALQVHHKTYEHHGMEHIERILRKDTVVLCENCHAKFHNKLPD
nr:MAG TPA: HNH endonuclease bacteriophage, HNH Endonuclease, DNA.52A [Bacteriophage sp.]